MIFLILAAVLIAAVIAGLMSTVTAPTMLFMLLAFIVALCSHKINPR